MAEKKIRARRAAGSKEPTWVTSDQLKELRHQISQKLITRAQMQDVIDYHGDPLSKFEPSGKLWRNELNVMLLELGESDIARLSLDIDQLDENVLHDIDRVFAFMARMVEPIKAFVPDYETELRPPIPDLEERVYRSIFWRECHLRGVRVMPMSLVAATADDRVSVKFETLQQAWANPIQNEDWFKTSDRYFPDAIGQLVECIAEYFKHHSINECDVWSTLEKHFGHDDDVFQSADDWRYTFPVVCQYNLAVALGLAVGFHLAGDHLHAKMLRPYLSLFLEGNFPLGYDSTGQLIVITA